jgi:penicillin-binding protein 2
MGLFSDRRRPVMSGPVIEDEGSLRVKVWLLGFFVVLLFGILTIQLVRLQILNHEKFDTRATINRIRTIDSPPVRGLILDRNGNPLVENIPAFAITIVPADVPVGSERDVAARLSELLNVPQFEIETSILEGRRSIDPFLPVVLVGDADEGLVFAVSARSASLPGVQIETVAKRLYDNDGPLSHVLGYIGPITREEFDDLQSDRYRLSDQIGQTGVEAWYEPRLRGVPGRRQVEVDASGREIRELISEDPTPGQGIKLTIDLPLQERVQEILLESMGGSLFAGAVVVDVHTGDILAIVSVPTFDNNIFSGEIDEEDLEAILTDPGRPLVNHVIADQFPSGSTFKVVTGVAALEEGLITADQLIVSEGLIEIQNEVDPRITYQFRDTVSGTFNFVSGLANSSNIYFWQLAGGSPFRREIAPELLTPEGLAEQERLRAAGIVGGEQDFTGLGSERLAAWARAFGLDKASGIDLAGEASGFVPDAQWKLDTFGEAWGQGDSYNLGVGQGFLAVTPLQMAMATAALANGGTIYQPRVVNEILDMDGNTVERRRPEVRSQLDLSAETQRLLRLGMGMAVLGGSAGNAWFREMQVAGKTGTAEFGSERLFRGNFPTHGWFIGFAPFEEPEIAIVVFHELGAGFLTAEAGGQIFKAWGELNGVFDETEPALPQLSGIAEGLFEALLARLEERLP